MERDKLTIDYASYMKSSSVLHKALDSLQQYGLLFLSSVPSDSESISRIASRIGPLRNTLYGSTWDVKSVPNAKNIAYKSSNLGFHMVSRAVSCYPPPLFGTDFNPEKGSSLS